MTKQEKLIEELKRLIQEYDRDTSYADEFARNYRQIPTIEAELIRHGKWTQICDTNNWQYINEHYRCSECLETSAYKSNYCPNCGATMDEEK